MRQPSIVQQEPSAADTYVHAYAAECKYFPFFGESDFQGDYEKLSPFEKSQGVLRVLKSALDLERMILAKSDAQLLRSAASGLSDVDLRFKVQTSHVHKITEARLKAVEEAIEGMEALLTNWQSSQVSEKRVSESDSTQVDADGGISTGETDADGSADDSESN